MDIVNGGSGVMSLFIPLNFLSKQGVILRHAIQCKFLDAQRSKMRDLIDDTSMDGDLEFGNIGWPLSKYPRSLVLK